MCGRKAVSLEMHTVSDVSAGSPADVQADIFQVRPTPRPKAAKAQPMHSPSGAQAKARTKATKKKKKKSSGW